MVAGDELAQILALQRVRLQREVLVGAEVVDPEGRLTNGRRPSVTLARLK